MSSSSEVIAPSDAVAPPSALDATVRRIGSPAFGSNPTFVAISPDERTVLGSMGMAGAEIDVFERDAAPRRIHVDLEEAVRTLDVSPDGMSLAVSVVERSRSSVRVVSIADGKTSRTISLSPDGAPHAGAEARFLADGSLVAWSGGKVLHWGPGADTPMEVMSAPDAPRISTSADKRWFVIATATAVSLRRSDKPAKVVTERAVTDRRLRGTARAFVDDTGALLFTDGEGVVLRSANGKEKTLGEGAAGGLSAGLAVVETFDDARRPVITLHDRARDRRASFAGARGFLSPSGATLYVHSGADASHAVVPIATTTVFDGVSGYLRGSPRYMTFGPDGELLVLDDKTLVAFDAGTGGAKRRSNLPSEAYEVNGIFRTSSDVFILGGPSFRRTDSGFEQAGSTWARRPKAFVRRDGSTIICISDAKSGCQGSLVMAPGARQIPEPLFHFIFPFAEGRGFLEGPYKESGSDLGVARVIEATGALPLDERWLTDVDLWWAAPTEEGGVVVTAEGKNRLKRAPFVRRVTARGLSAPCALGAVAPTLDAAIAVSPDGRAVAVPVDRADDATSAVLVVDPDTCSVAEAPLAARPVSADYSPDGRRLAVGLVDRTIVVFTLGAHQ